MFIFLIYKRLANENNFYPYINMSHARCMQFVKITNAMLVYYAANFIIKLQKLVSILLIILNNIIELYGKYVQ